MKNKAEIVEWLTRRAGEYKHEAGLSIMAARAMVRSARVVEAEWDDLKPQAQARYRAAADAVEEAWLDRRLEERRAMKARGEDVVVPENREGLRAQIAKEEQDRRRG